jgi:hypothetical protein
LEQTVVANMKMVERGFHWVIAGPPVLLGHPRGNAYLDKVYQELTAQYGFSKKPALKLGSRSLRIEENSGIIKSRYEAMGGTIELKKKGVGHHPHGLEDPSPILDFIARNASR